MWTVGSLTEGEDLSAKHDFEVAGVQLVLLIYQHLFPRGIVCPSVISNSRAGGIFPFMKRTYF